MLDAHEERFRWIYRDHLERPAGDYGELLRRGEVSSRKGVDSEQWRAEIRRQARQDKVRVITCRSGEQRAFAMLARTVSDEQVFEVKQRALEQVVALGEIREISRVLGHELSGWVRHQDEFISVCERCAARTYVRLAAERIEDGEALSEPCPGERA